MQLCWLAEMVYSLGMVIHVSLAGYCTHTLQCCVLHTYVLGPVWRVQAWEVAQCLGSSMGQVRVLTHTHPVGWCYGWLHHVPRMHMLCVD
jgi:hypothetical protein